MDQRQLPMPYRDLNYIAKHLYYLKIWFFCLLSPTEMEHLKSKFLQLNFKKNSLSNFKSKSTVFAYVRYFTANQ